MEASIEIGQSFNKVPAQGKMKLYQEEDTISEADKEWIQKYNGYQISDLKYPTFDNNIIDDQLKTEITYEIFLNDMKSVVDIISSYLNSFTSLLVSNTNNIVESFKSYKLSFIQFHINAFFLERELELMSMVFKLKYEYINADQSAFMNIIRNKYGKCNVDEVIEQWSQNETYRKLICYEIDDISEVREIFEKRLENEMFMLEYTHEDKPTPAVCVSGILVKYLRFILERSLINMDFLKEKITEEILLDFFQDCIKLQVFALKIKCCFNVPQEDIFNKSENSDEWVKLKKNYERIVRILN